MNLSLKYCIYFSLVLVFFSCLNKNGEKNEKTNNLSAEIEKREREIDSLKKIDFLSKKYKFLDKKFNLNVDNSTFQKAIKKYKFYPQKIKTYKDSLNVILTYELDSYHGANMATRRITYKWKKIGYYIWENNIKSKEIGLSFGYSHPYKFYEFLISERENDSLKIIFFKDLKRKLVKELNDSITIKPYKQFLKFAFKNNPKRIHDMNNQMKNNKHRH
ncbi:hypothetical protein F7018_05380 [Tenacibaculum aiptasiae]|uniref:Uncharacterized protein n=1 Tax=Tenacibaculum aiptasiae TaxID=426481 RepID=A0A7J5AQE7_9FLAO|nr:hypothetical protein [Tenacibaculum aiptasiae]KAB1159742.1 hypothetical protein F7018_05380 [Tenacibaculum aiptasiae]